MVSPTPRKRWSARRWGPGTARHSSAASSSQRLRERLEAHDTVGHGLRSRVQHRDVCSRAMAHRPVDHQCGGGGRQRFAYLPIAALTPLLGALCFQFDGIFTGAMATREMRNMMVLVARHLSRWLVVAGACLRQCRIVGGAVPVFRGAGRHICLGHARNYPQSLRLLRVCAPQKMRYVAPKCSGHGRLNNWGTNRHVE